jgi:hypothetical protein
MRTDFFYLSKAKEYIAAINNLLPTIASLYDEGFEPSTELKIMWKETADLKFKIKLLFKEFNNGELFFQSCMSIDENRLLVDRDEEALELYKHTLSLLVDHIRTYRLIPAALAE